MPSAKTTLPTCGLYRTTKALPGHEDRVGAGLLVYFHNHSDSGLPQVILPDHNMLNRWHFHGPGIEFRSLSWAETLVKMPPEGFYVLSRDVRFDGGILLKNALVQLGYTREGEAIAFMARVRAALQENDLFFSDRGAPIKPDQLSALDAVIVEQEPTGNGHGPANMH